MRRDLRYLRGVATIELFSERCNGCGMCAVVCPHGVMRLDNSRAMIEDRDACMECGACSRNCPEEAISVQAGVGCAQAVINNAFGRSSSCCDLSVHETSNSMCEPEEPGKDSSGCC